MVGRVFQEDLLEVGTTHGQNEFVSLEDFPARCYRHVHHLLVLLQTVESTAHVSVEVVPRQQVLVDVVVLRLLQQLLPTHVFLARHRVVWLLVLLLVEVLVLRLLVERCLWLHHHVVVVGVSASRAAVIVRVVIVAERHVIVVVLHPANVAVVAVRRGQVQRHGIVVHRPDRLGVLHHVRNVQTTRVVVVGRVAVVVVILPVQAVLALDLRRDRIGGRDRVRHSDAVLKVAVVQVVCAECLCGGEEAQRGIVDLVAEVDVHHVEEGPVATLRLLGHLDRLVLLQQVVPFLDDLGQGQRYVQFALHDSAGGGGGGEVVVEGEWKKREIR